MLHASVSYDLAPGKGPASLNQRLERCLPCNCSIRRLDYLFQNVATLTSAESIRNATQCLVDAVTVANKVSNDHNGSVLKGNEIVSLKRGPKINAVVDWKSGQIIPSRIRSMEIDQTFVDNKKYLIIGLAGDLGRSIARFMVERGARHVVRRRLLIRARRGQDRLMISPWR